MGGTSMRSTGNGSRRRRILVVDDEPAFAELMADFFSGLPGSPSVTVAGEGLAAPGAAARAVADVVLPDLKMPGMETLAVIESTYDKESTNPTLLPSGTASPNGDAAV